MYKCIQLYSEALGGHSCISVCLLFVAFMYCIPVCMNNFELIINVLLTKLLSETKNTLYIQRTTAVYFEFSRQHF